MTESLHCIFTVRQIKNVFMILIFPISLNRKSQLTGLNWLAMHCQIIDYIDIDLTELPDDEHFKVCYTNAEIVNRLLLSTTTHSGGTSTRQKCKELGLDSSKSIEFSFSTEE